MHLWLTDTDRTLIDEDQVVMTKENSPSNFSKIPSEFIAKRVIEVEPGC